MENRCRGMEGGICSSTTEDCGYNLSCNEHYGFGSTRHSTPLQHHYCSFKKHQNTYVYEDIGRTDEKIINVGDPTTLNRLAGKLAKCTYDLQQGGFSGVFCGEVCKKSWEWCSSSKDDLDTCNIGGSILQTNDVLLCQDNLFWRDVGNAGCDRYYPNGQQYLSGSRCRGSVQECVYPWYSFNGGNTFSPYLLSCSDHSDQVMYLGATCPDPSTYLQLHHDIMIDHFHQTDEEWLAEKAYEHESYSDPHNCQASCSDPGPGCFSCTNTDYFQCSFSGLCLHPDLLCDGHPQCPFSEDESVEICFERWVGAKLVSPFGSLECSSARYPGMTIRSNPCDGIVKCADGRDEAFCKENLIVNYLLYGSCAVILILYVGLKISNKSAGSPMNNKARKVTEEDFENRVKIIRINAAKLHLIYTKDIESRKEKCLKFYKTLSKIHYNDESAIFICMHKLLDPAVTQVVHDSKFPGLKQKTIDKIQETFKTNCITSFQNFIIRHELLSQTIGLIKSVVKILASYIDLLKDIFLAFTLLNAVGGPASVLGHPTQFTSAIVMVMVVTIISPLVASSLHLILSNPFLLFNFDVSRSIAVILCFMFWILNPVLLRYRYESAKEKSRKMIMKDSKNLSTLLFRTEEKVIKTCLVQFQKIELGKTEIL